MATSAAGVTSSGLFEDVTNEITGKVRKNGVVQQATIGSLLAGPGKDIGLGFLLHLYRKRQKARALSSSSIENSTPISRTQNGTQTKDGAVAAAPVFE